IARLKTGNGTVAGERASWVVGEIEAHGSTYVFASRVRSSARTLETTAGSDLAVRVLNTIPPTPAPIAAHGNAVTALFLGVRSRLMIAEHDEHEVSVRVLPQVPAQRFVGVRHRFDVAGTEVDPVGLLRVRPHDRIGVVRPLVEDPGPRRLIRWRWYERKMRAD